MKKFVGNVKKMGNYTERLCGGRVSDIEVVFFKYLLPLCAVILTLLGVFVGSMLESAAAGHPWLMAKSSE